MGKKFAMLPPNYPAGFFDGALAKKMGCGQSSNTRAELLALWALLIVSKLLGIPL